MRARPLGQVLAFAAVSGVSALTLAVPASAQTYPPGPPTSPPGNSGNTPAGTKAQGVPFRDGTVVRPGQRGTASFPAGSFTPGSEVTGTFGGTAVGTAIVGKDGSVNFPFTIPDTATFGAGTLVLSGVSNGASTRRTVGLTVAGAAGGGALGLPRTGTDAVVPMAASGIALVVVGAGVVVVARRRRRELDGPAVA